MLNAGGRWWGFVFLVCACTQAAAQPADLPSDISVGLTAEPSTNLQSWQPITFTLSVTNHGPEPVSLFAIRSSPIYDEFDFDNATSDCQYIVLAVVDLTDGFYFLYYWYPALETAPPIAVNETRSCHLTLPLTAAAPAVMPFSFRLGSRDDLDPSNNEATVVLRRAVEPTAIPVLSPAVLFGLALLLVTSAVSALRQRRTVHRRV